MRTPHRVRFAALVSVLPLTLLAVASPSSSALEAGVLRISPDEYVGGQMLTFEGNIGATGVREVQLEAHLGREGDSWTPLPGATGTTDASGDFSFEFRAPSMFNIKYRAASGAIATDPLNFHARSQDLTLVPVEPPVAGRPFEITVDTTPGLARRPDTDQLPAFPGRTVTLQQRVDVGWQDVSTATTDQEGLASFPQVRVAEPGTVVYRAVQEDWAGPEGKDQIGWMPSFPTYVDVRAPGSPVVSPVAAPESTPTGRATSSLTPARTNGDVKTDTAAELFGWRPSLWDFAWVAGESLTTPPYRGKGPLTGWWLDSSTGTGRASKHNGGLELDSQRANVDDDATCLRSHTAMECLSAGTTAATLQDADRAYGRWEVRVRTKSSDASTEDFRTLIELVPAADPECAAQTITVADMAAHDPVLQVGARSGSSQSQWRRSVSVGNINNVSMTVAVEVSKRRITWFRNGKVIGSLRSAAAVPDVPLTLRLSQAGDGQQEMNRTQTIFDWMRGFDLKRGDLVTKGPRLTRSDWSGGC